MRHLRYLERHGAQRDGSRGHVYAAEEDEADGKAFVETSAQDRHHFRVIVSAEEGAEYDELKPLVRRFMAQMEKDLGTRLQWIAVDHDNTAHPHSHILLRGRDEFGKDLIIAPEYICHGMRERATDLVTTDLGPRSEMAIQNQYRHELAPLMISRPGSMISDRKLEVGIDDLFRHEIRIMNGQSGIGDVEWSYQRARSGPTIG
jgi:type IV secretory pathway VirD2 relaxase